MEAVTMSPQALLSRQGFGLVPIGFLPGDHAVAQDADFLDLALHDIPGLQIPSLGIAAEGSHTRNGSGGYHVARAIAHRRIMGKNLGDLYRHLAGMRPLARLSIHA